MPTPQEIAEYRKRYGIPDDWEFTPYDAPAPQAAPQGETSSTLGAVARAAGRAALPTLGGIGAGALGGAWLGPPGMIVGGILGGIGTGYAQEKALEHLASPEWNAERQKQYEADIQQHPYATIGGELLPSALTLRPSLGGLKSAAQAIRSPSTATAAQKVAAGTVGLGAGIGAVQETAIPYFMGQEIDPRRVVASTLFGSLFNEPTRLGRAMGLPGSPVEAQNAPTGQPEAPAGRIQPSLLLPEVSDSTLMDRASRHVWNRPQLPLMSESTRQMPAPGKPGKPLSPLAEVEALLSYEQRLIKEQAPVAPAIDVETINSTPIDSQSIVRQKATTADVLPAKPRLDTPPPAEDAPGVQAQTPARRSYGQKFLDESGLDGAIARIEHLRKRADRVPGTREAVNLAEESDNIGRAITIKHPTYDWVTNKVLPPAEDPVKAVAEAAQVNHEAAKAELEATKAAPQGPPEARVAALDAARQTVKATGEARNQVVEAASELPQRVKIAGAEFDVVSKNEDGTLKVRNENGDEFDTAPGEKWFGVAGKQESSGPTLDTAKTSRAQFQKEQVDRIRSLRQIALLDAENEIKRSFKPSKPLPVGISKVTALMQKARKTPEERRLLARYSNAKRNTEADIRVDFETAGRVWDSIASKQKPLPHSPDRYRVGKNPQPYDFVEAIPRQPGDLPGESFIRLRNPQNGETGVFEASTVTKLGDKALRGNKVASSPKGESRPAGVPQTSPDSQSYISSAAADAGRATEAWGKHSVEVVEPLRERIRKLNAEVQQMAGDAKRTLPETKGKQRLTKQAFLDQYGVASMEDANALYKKKNAEWAALEKDLETAEAKLKDLAKRKDDAGRAWSRAVDRSKESPQFQPESSLVKPAKQEHPYQFRVEYEYPDGRRGAVVSREPLIPGSILKAPEGNAKVVRAVEYDRAYQLAEQMPAEALLYAPVNERFLQFTKAIADRHNVSVKADDNIRTPDGQLAAGVAHVKERLAKLNPARAGLDTGLHEVGHVFLDDLRTSQVPAERALYQRGLDTFQGDAERLAEAVGLRASDLMRSRIEGSLLGKFREWAKDFWSYIKSKWGMADSQDFKALLARRMLDAEPVVSKASHPDDVAPQFQKDSRAHLAEQELQKEDTFASDRLESLKHMGRSVAENIAAIGEDGKWIVQNVASKLYETRRHFNGKYRNYVETMGERLGFYPNAISQLKGKAFTPQDEALAKYLYDVADTGKSSVKLSEAQTKAVEEWRRVAKETAEDFNQAGGKVSDGKQWRPLQTDPTWFPQMIDTRAQYVLAEKPNSAEARAFKRDLHEWLSKGGKKGQKAAWKREDIEELWNNMTSSHEGQRTAAFNALEESAGFGLPQSMRERSAFRAMSRYLDRYSRKMAELMHITGKENPDNAIARRFFNMDDQYGERTTGDLFIPGTQTLAESRSGHSDVKAFVKDFFGDYSTSERRLDAWNRLVKVTMLGPMTGAVDVSSSFSLAAQHLDAGDYLTIVPKAVMNFKQGILAGIRQDVIQSHTLRAQTSIEGGSHLSYTADRLNRLADSIATITGRDGLEKFARGMLMEIGRLKVLSELGSKFTNHAHSSRFLDTFAKGEWEQFAKGGLSSIPTDVVEKWAAKFVESVQGTYDARNLPSWALQGNMAPIFSLAKFSIEKLGNFRKHVIEPLKRGDLKPLLMLTVASGVTAEGIEELREFLTGRKQSHASWKEIVEAGGDGLVYRLFAMASYTGFSGAAADILKQGADMWYGQKPQGYRYPLLEAMAGVIDRGADAATAIKRGENAADVMFHRLPVQLAKDNVQAARLILRWASEDAKAAIEAGNQNRDLRVFRQLRGIPTTPSVETANPFLGTEEREFKRTKDPMRAAEMAPGLVQRALEKSGGDREALSRNLQSLRTPAQMPYPSQRSRPQELNSYLSWLGETQGQEAVQKALQDIALRESLNSMRSAMVPRL